MQLTTPRDWAMPGARTQANKTQHKYFRSRALSAWCLLLSALLFVLPARAQQTLFEDNFNSINTNVWDVHDSSWNLHRTRFGKAPTVQTESGVTFARFSLDTFNSDSRYSGSFTQGTEMWSKQQFAMGNGVEFEARVRSTNIPRGVVHAFFTYKQRDFNTDDDQEEIDFENIGNFINNPADAEKIWLNIWNGRVDDRPSQPGVAGLNQRNWNTYTMRWTNTKVEWLINGVLIRTETEVMPDEFMSLCFNIWAPNNSWTTSYDSSLQIASSAANNQNYYFDVDYVRVRSVAPAAGSGVIGTGTGLTATYYDNPDFTQETITRLAPRINFNWQQGAPISSMGSDNWSARFVGVIQPQFTENYTFYTNTDDGVRLRINNQLLIDKFIAQAATEYSATIRLTAGQLYPIEIEYFEDTFGASAQLRWSSPSTPKQFVPTTQLYPAQVSTPAFSPNGGTFATAQAVTVTVSTPGAAIHYTLNGAEPTRTDPVVPNGGVVQVTTSATLRAKAWRDGYRPSNTQSATFTFTADNQPPVASINTPTHTWSYPQLATVTGNASDTGNSGLQSVTVRLGRYSDNQYWNGNAWSPTPADLPVNGTTNWTFTLPSLVDGKYFVRATARDGAGNAGNSDVIDFYIDKTAPNVVITTPVANGTYRSLAQASGTAQDVGPGVGEVRVRLFRAADNTYWNGTGWTSAISDVPANGTTNWSWNLPPLDAGRYGIQAIARDYVGNTKLSDAVAFTIDAQPPIVAFTQPAPNAVLRSLAALAGTAEDAGGAGIAEVRVTLQRSDGQFWNGSNWAPTPAEVVATGTTIWAVPLPPLGDGTYAARAVALDAAANVSAPVDVAFTIDQSAPVVAITQPANNSTGNAFPAVAGTVSDNLTGVARVELSIRRQADNAFWDGANWSGAPVALATALNGTNWSRDSGLPPGAEGVYFLTATAFDNVGNNAASATVTFTLVTLIVDRIAPTISITSLRNGATLRNLPTIGGTANDTGGSGLWRVEMVVQRAQDKKFWSGRSWGVNSVRLPATLSGNGWKCSVMPTGANLKDDLYTLVAVAYDRQWNRGTTIIRVGVDSRPPEVVWTAPLPGSRLASLPTLSGRVTDAFAGVSAVDIVIQRRSDRFFWNGRTWQSTSARLPALRKGTALSQTWTLGSNLPSGANLVAGSYDLVAVAYDKSNNRSSAVSTIVITSTTTAASTTATSTTRQATPSALSRAALQNSDTVVLQFVSALDATDAGNPANYEVRVNGVPVSVESASYSASTSRVALSLENALQAGDIVTVEWRDLLNGTGQPLASGEVTLTAP